MQLFKKLFYTLTSVAGHPLNRHSKLRSLLTYGIVQTAVRWVPGDICVRFPNQTRLVLSPRMKGAAHFVSPGLCEFDDMCFVTHFLRPGDLFADAGSNIGAFTVLASGVAGAKTVAFEPSPSTFQYLMDNVRINALTENVTSLNVALGRKEGTARLTENLGTENYVCTDREMGGHVQVRITTLDQVFAESVPILIKIDVEGFETEVIAGAERVLAEKALQAIIIERAGAAGRYGYDEDALHRTIRSQSFIPCAYAALQRRLSRIPEDSQGNIIYVRDFDAVQERLRNAPSFKFANLEI